MMVSVTPIVHFFRRPDPRRSSIADSVRAFVVAAGTGFESSGLVHCNLQWSSVVVNAAWPYGVSVVSASDYLGERVRCGAWAACVECEFAAGRESLELLERLARVGRRCDSPARVLAWLWGVRSKRPPIYCVTAVQLLLGLDTTPACSTPGRLMDGLNQRRRRGNDGILRSV